MSKGFSARGYSPITGIDAHTHRIIEAATHTAEQRGVPVEDVLAEWVIERESLHAEIVHYATPITDRVRGMREGGAFDKEHVGAIQRRWVIRLRDVIAKGRIISDWRLQADRPLALSTDERNELERARAVVMSVHRWLHIGADRTLSLADAEREIAVRMREYDPATAYADFRTKTNTPA